MDCEPVKLFREFLGCEILDSFMAYFDNKIIVLITNTASVVDEVEKARYYLVQVESKSRTFFRLTPRTLRK